MQKSNTRIVELIETGHLKLLLIFFGVALIARGGVLAQGFAIDDYSFAQGFTPEEFGIFVVQGRFLLAAVDWVIYSLGVNITDIYISLGLVSLLLQAGLVLAVLRFVGVADKRGAVIAGSLMVAHPYLAEILTFRMALPGYCIGAALTILVLESASCGGAKKSRCLFVSFAAAVGMLFIYQGFLNYFSAALIFCMLFDELSPDTKAPSVRPLADSRGRIVNLLLVCIASIMVFVVIVSAAKRSGLMELTSRAKFIKMNEVPERISQIGDLIAKMYWLGEPTGTHWVKVMIAAMLGIAVLTVGVEIFTGSREDSRPYKKIAVLSAVLLLALATVGVILPFKDWWPVPRVLSQASLIIGLMFLLGFSILDRKPVKIPVVVCVLSFAVLMASFIFKSNQVFADQLRLNAWDKMKANRIVARLEEEIEFSKIEYVFIGGGRWGYPAGLNTIQGDMNISGFYPDYARLPLLVETSGYKFKPAFGDQIIRGENVCKNVSAWPSNDSVSVFDNLAVICLGD